MSLLQLILNLLWILTGGVWMAAGWLLAAVLMAVTIIGIPWTRAAFNIAAYTLLPFGHKAVPRSQWTGRENLGPGRWACSAIFYGLSSLAGGWPWAI